MKDKLIGFETAKLAKEKGFDWMSYFYEDGCFFDEWLVYEDSQIDIIRVVLRPTQSLLQRWLREVHFTFINIAIYKEYEDCKTTYDYAITDLNNPYDINDNEIFEEDYGNTEDRLFKTYEDALEKAIQQALKLIK